MNQRKLVLVCVFLALSFESVLTLPHLPGSKNKLPQFPKHKSTTISAPSLMSTAVGRNFHQTVRMTNATDDSDFNFLVDEACMAVSPSQSVFIDCNNDNKQITTRVYNSKADCTGAFSEATRATPLVLNDVSPLLSQFVFTCDPDVVFNSNDFFTMTVFSDATCADQASLVMRVDLRLIGCVENVKTSCRDNAYTVSLYDNSDCSGAPPLQFAVDTNKCLESDFGGMTVMCSQLGAVPSTKPEEFSIPTWVWILGSMLGVMLMVGVVVFGRIFYKQYVAGDKKKHHDKDSKAQRSDEDESGTSSATTTAKEEETRTTTTTATATATASKGKDGGEILKSGNVQLKGATKVK